MVPPKGLSETLNKHRDAIQSSEQDCRESGGAIAGASNGVILLDSRPSRPQDHDACHHKDGQGHGTEG